MSVKKLVVIAVSFVFFLVSVFISKGILHKQQMHLLQEGKDFAKAAQHGKAIEAFGAFLKFRPGDVEAQEFLLESYVQKGDREKADALAQEMLEQDEQNVTALFALGESALASEHWDRAKSYFQKVVDVHAEELRALRGLGFAALGKGDNKTAQEWLDKAIKLSNEDPRTLLGHGLLLHAQGKNEDALRYLKKAADALGVDPVIAEKMVAIYLDTGNFVEAQEVYQKLLATNPDSLDAQRGMARVWETGGQIDQAIGQYQKVLAAQPDDVKSALALSRMYRDAGKIDEALALLEGLQNRLSGDMEIETAYARAVAEKGEADKALEILGKVGDRNKSFLPAYLARCFAYGKKGNWDGAIEEARKALAIDRKYTDGFFELGKAYLGKGMAYEGIQELQKILEINPRYPHVHYYIGLGFLNGGFPDVAIEEFKTELSRNSGSISALYHLAIAQSKAGKMEEASAGYAKVLEAEPGNMDALYNLALTHAKGGKTDEAIREFEKILSSKADDLPSTYNLGILYAKANQVEKALGLFKKVLQLDPNNLDAHDNLAMLYERQENLDEAIRENQAILQVPGLEAADVVWVHLAELWMKKKDAAKAKEAADKALAINPSARISFLAPPPTKVPSPEPTGTALAPASEALALQVKEFLTKGNIYFDQGQLQEAKNQWEEAIRLDPDNAAAATALEKLKGLRVADQAKVRQEEATLMREAAGEQSGAEQPPAEMGERGQKALAGKIREGLSQGNLFMQVNDYTSALREYQNVLAIDPSNTEAKENIAQATAELDKKRQGAKQEEQKAVTKDRNISGLLSQGEVQFKQGSFDEAIDVWNKVLETQPTNADALAKIAEAKDLKMARDSRKKKELEARDFAKQRALIRIKEAQLKRKKEVAVEGAYRSAEVPVRPGKKKLHLAKKRDAFLDERFLDETLASITSD